MAGVVAHMDSEVSPEANRVTEREWPSSGSAYWALFVIVLATFLTFFDAITFGMLAERIKRDFGLTDSQLGFLAGPASIICYFFVGIPLARLADIYPRKYVLGAGAALVGVIIAAGGLAQSFGQFVGSRVFLAAGGSAHAPSSYSLLADAFPPKKLTRAFALLQFGFIGGTTLGPLIGGMLVMATAGWGSTQLGPLTILGWQWILIFMGLPSLLVALLFLTVKEPMRMAPVADALQVVTGGGFWRSVATFMGLDAFRAINAKPRVYYPLFGALALSAVETFGLQFWRVPFMIRTFGWNEGQIGAALGGTILVASLSGLLLGGILVEWLAKRYKDANVRAATCCFAGVTVCTIAAILMPTAWGSLILFGLSGMFGIAGAVPQNAAVQRVAPNDMRGQVTAFYLFMFTFFGAMGSYVVGKVQDVVIGDPAQLWKALLITACVLMPLATLLMFRAIKPYREEVERLEALGR
ncbi:MAG: MFS transporter [Novosphingobium sp. 28-62-57]|uniref:MFS transporter n=1 Tax=unclassified Novosphingobium TaxID=2644732 RepID=UPI000BDBB63E|nr:MULTISPECIES: MFS transporter [unclassified Novosphingobium]OYW48754.1 MAG: MFS transporter [Novosphingobium sp. 12-62-10]OYZ08261.1 MAG: MFS transporter [Novosphingobium sp. 28-62-57]OZA33221.1 MAG: MFS transporter [Novosphingobium sp. 17-62-9]